MKNAVLTLILLATGVAVAEEDIRSKFGPRDTGISEEERIKRRDQKRHEKLLRTGGRAYKMSCMKGSFLFVNNQNSVSQDKMDDIIDGLKKALRCDFRFTNVVDKVTLSNISSQLALLKTNGAVFIIDDETLPTILTAPESRWALINIRALSADKPTADTLSERVHRELWRAFAYLCGSNSLNQYCVVQPAFSLYELDAIRAKSLSEDPLMRSEIGLKAMGVTPYEITTYRQACEEGWAHAPTNEYQKAIWEETRKLPEKPIKIEFDPKKGK